MQQLARSTAGMFRPFARRLPRLAHGGVQLVVRSAPTRASTSSVAGFSTARAGPSPATSSPAISSRVSTRQRPYLATNAPPAGGDGSTSRARAQRSEHEMRAWAGDRPRGRALRALGERAEQPRAPSCARRCSCAERPSGRPGRSASRARYSVSTASPVPGGHGVLELAEARLDRRRGRRFSRRSRSVRRIRFSCEAMLAMTRKAAPGGRRRPRVAHPWRRPTRAARPQHTAFSRPLPASRAFSGWCARSSRRATSASRRDVGVHDRLPGAEPGARACSPTRRSRARSCPVFTELLEKGKKKEAFHVASSLFFLILLIARRDHGALHHLRRAADVAVRARVRRQPGAQGPDGRPGAADVPDRPAARAERRRRRDAQQLRALQRSGAGAGRPGTW